MRRGGQRHRRRGPIVGLAGYATLAIVGACVAAALGPFLIAVSRGGGVPARVVAANRSLS